MIVTAQPEPVVRQILECLERGVTELPGKGAYTGAQRTVLYCVVNRSQVAQLKAIVQETDPQAFMVIGQAHEALGEGFRPFQKK
jgi:uncharacterized membrane-anchored protein YitT (DUF2179 family)